MSIEFSDGKQEVPYHNDSFFWIVSGTVVKICLSCLTNNIRTHFLHKYDLNLFPLINIFYPFLRTFTRGGTLSLSLFIYLYLSFSLSLSGTLSGVQGLITCSLVANVDQNQQSVLSNVQ